MTEEELLALLSTSPAGIRGAQNAKLAATRTPLANIEAGAPPAYRVPLMRAGGGQNFVYPGFGIDPERNPGTTLPPGGTRTPGAGAPAAASGIDINALLAGLGGGVPATGGGSSGGGLGRLAGGAGLTVAALGALLKAAPWLARQLGLTDQEAAAVAGLSGYDQFAQDLVSNAALPGIESTLGATDPGFLASRPDPSFFDAVNREAMPQSGEFADAQNWASNPDTTYQVNASDFASGAVAGSGFPIPDTILPTEAYGSLLDWANTAPLPDTGFNPIGTIPDEAYLNVASDAAAPDVGSGFGGPLIDPASFGIPDASFDLLGMSIDPFSIAGGALGSWGGGKLASNLVQGDEQQGWSSKIGGLAGGAIGSLIFPGVGTLLGSFLGSLGAGTLGAGEPDYGYGYIGGTGGGPQINFWQPNALNNGSTAGLNELSAGLQKYLADRAAGEGYVVNPELVNQSLFSAGRTQAPGGKWFVGGMDASPSQAAYDGRAVWRGDDIKELPGQVWNTLVGSGAYAKPGTFTDWATVKQNIDEQRNTVTPVHVSRGEAGDFLEYQTNENPTYQGQRGSWAGPSGYWSWEGEITGGGEAGDTRQMVWHDAAPSSAPASPSPTPEAPPPPPEIDTYNQGGAARTGGLIPPTAGGTQPVPIKAHTGEFVIRPEAVAKFGPEMLTSINRGTFPHQMPNAGDTDVVVGMEDDMSGDEYGGFDAFTRPYANVEEGGPSPFERVTAGATGGDPMADLRDLPPEIQQGMLLALGADPLVASAWLQVLGPEYQQVIAAALKAAGAMKQQQAMMAAAAQPMPGAPPAGPGMIG